MKLLAHVYTKLQLALKMLTAGNTLKFRLIIFSRLMKIGKRCVEAVLFDLGGTLVRTTEIPVVLRKILKHRGITRSITEISVARKKAEAGLNFRDLTTLLDEFWVQWNLRILSILKINANPRLLAQYIATHWWDYCDVMLYPDAERVLYSLKKKGLKMGIISNGLDSDVYQILSKVNLQTFFDVVVTINTLKKMKPDPEMFMYALEKLEATYSKAIFIGDEMEADYNGACKVGLPVYIIDRDGKVGDVRALESHKISSLEELFNQCVR